MDLRGVFFSAAKEICSSLWDSRSRKKVIAQPRWRKLRSNAMNPSDLRRRSKQSLLRLKEEQQKGENERRANAEADESDSAKQIISIISQKVEECVQKGETECCILLVKNF